LEKKKKKTWREKKKINIKTWRKKKKTWENQEEVQPSSLLST